MPGFHTAVWVANSVFPNSISNAPPTLHIGFSLLLRYDHVNVLHDYKKTGSSKILNLLTCCCHHLIDTLLTHLKCLNVPGTSIFLLVAKKLQKTFRLLKSSKSPQLHCQHVLPANLPMCLAQMQLCQMI